MLKKLLSVSNAQESEKVLNLNIVFKELIISREVSHIHTGN